MDLVSVVMASYNYENFILETIEGILNQTWKNIELIIVDDASKDNSRELINSCHQKDNRIRMVFHEKNMGIAKTFNDGIDNAKGKFVAITGCDDVWYENKLEKQLKILKKNEDMVVYTNTSIIDAESNLVKASTKTENCKKRKRNGRIFKELLGGNFVCGSSIILKRDNLNGLRFDEQYRYVNDYKFTLELARKYEFCFIPEPLVKYRVHGNNVTLRDHGGWLRDFASFGKDLLEQYQDDFPNKAKAGFLFKIACDASYRGDKEDSRKYAIKALTAYPFRTKYWKHFISPLNRNTNVHGGE